MNWWRCNTICGGGVQSRVVQCVQYDEFGNKKVLPSSKCDASQKPPTKQPCNTHTCGQWKLSEWSDCVPNCGQGYKNRSVICVNENNEEIDSINCRQPIPASVEPCFNEPCYYKWTPGPWGIVSVYGRVVLLLTLCLFALFSVQISVGMDSDIGKCTAQRNQV